MSTIRIDILDESSIDAAIERLMVLSDSDMHTASTECLRGVATSIRDDMQRDVHIGSKLFQPKWDTHEPGRLLRSIHIENPDELHFQVIADAKDNRGSGYAETEQTRSPGNHDFTKDAMQNARLYIEMQKGWFSKL